MNRFGEIADELTDLIEELELHAPLAEVKPLKAALQRAFAKACEAERALRALEPAVPAQRSRRGRRPSPPGDGSGVVIQLPRAWRLGAAGARRLVD
jgi:hypothetical protein